jgi:hypothetical protein
MFINANMEADKNNKYTVLGIVFGVRRQQEGYIIAYLGRRLLEAKIGMCLLNSNACTIVPHYLLSSICVQQSILSDRIA